MSRSGEVRSGESRAGEVRSGGSRFGELSVEEFLAAVAAHEPAPGGGAAAATTAALAAGLVAMAARFSLARMPRADETAERADVLRRRVLGLADDDAAAYTAVLEAYRLPKNMPERRERITAALEGACEIPLRIAEWSVEIVALAGDVSAQGNPNLAGDAGTAHHLAMAAARSAVELAQINIRLGDLGPDPVKRAETLLTDLDRAAGRR